MKEIEFLGSSLRDLQSFPKDLRRKAGFELQQVQRGFEPSDFKPMPSVGTGVEEMRLWDTTGTFRVSILRGWRMLFTSCMPFRRRLKLPPRGILRLRASDSEHSCK
jgi:hypothetical protein